MLDKKEEPEEALPWLEHLHALVPTDISILATLGRMHAKLGATDEAVRWLEEAHKAAPTNLGAITSLLDLLMVLKVNLTFDRFLLYVATQGYCTLMFNTSHRAQSCPRRG